MDDRQLREKFLEHLRVERGSSPHTLRAYDRTVRVLLPFLRERGLDVSSARRVDLRAFLFQVGQGRSSATLARHISALRALYRWLEQLEIPTRAQATALSPPRVRSAIPRVPSESQASDLMDTDPARSDRDQAILEVLYGAGLRVSELCGLDVRDVDLASSLLHVRHGKAGKERLAPVGPPAVAALSRWLKVRPESDDPGLFLNARGGRLSDRSVRRIVHRAGVRTGVLGLYPHALRHAFGTHLFDAGADLRSIQELLGHTSLATTQRYTHVSVKGLLETHRRAHPHAVQDDGEEPG
ncbi:MAG TPA: tyrosine recombinase XerC [Deltaproteobacteria bacterium]|nr:tyrosine recombinase XerC [Deltaproteobacteria bacterium]